MPANHPADHVVASRRALEALRLRRVWLAPVCLLLVAGLHGWRVATTGQTPWKGGSFGMFSTTDGENARFVRCWLLTAEQALPLEIPPELNKKVAELKAAPHADGVRDLAQRLAQRTWIDPQAAQQRLVEHWQQGNHARPLSADQLQRLRSEPSASPAKPTSLPRTGPLVAAAKSDRTAVAIPWDAIRVELWKYEFPAGTHQLHARQLFVSEEHSRASDSDSKLAPSPAVAQLQRQEQP
jgi:hypothetical protein